MNCVLKRKDLKMFSIKINKYDFHTLIISSEPDALSVHLFLDSTAYNRWGQNQC